MTASHHSIFTGQILFFLTPNEQFQSTEGIRQIDIHRFNGLFFMLINLGKPVAERINDGF